MFQILIVEDDKELSQLFRKVLEKNGYQVKCTSDGALALEILDKEYIDLIISDIMMPVSYTHLDVYKRQGLPYILCLKPQLKMIYYCEILLKKQ